MLHNATFDEDAVAQQTQGAGIVPIARGSDGRMYALLGKEHHVANWKGSCKWSGFEGGRKPEESVQETAIREWHEESLNVCHVTADDITEGNYVCKLVLHVNQNNHRLLRHSPARFHVTYLVEVPFDERAPERFRVRRRSVLSLYDSSERFRTSLSELTRIRSTVTDVRSDDGETVMTFADGASLCYEHPLATEVAECLRAHESMIDVYRKCDLHDCVQVKKTPDGRIVDVLVSEDYLEKEMVQWWSVDRLRDALVSGGRSHDDTFRAYFLPVVEAVIAAEPLVS